MVSCATKLCPDLLPTLADDIQRLSHKRYRSFRLFHFCTSHCVVRSLRVQSHFDTEALRSRYLHSELSSASIKPLFYQTNQLLDEFSFPTGAAAVYWPVFREIWLIGGLDTNDRPTRQVWC